jgi:hypothetical protein
VEHSAMQLPVHGPEVGIALHDDLSPKFPPSLHGVLGVKSVTLGGHFVHVLSLLTCPPKLPSV